MVLDRHRASLDWWLEPLARRLHGVKPDVFTWSSLVAAGAGSLAFYASDADAPGLLLVGWAMVLLNSVLDLLDGKVAVMTDQATPRGDFLDHSIDRFSDVLFLGGIALSPWAHTAWGILAIVGTLLTSYMGTQAQAIGIGRNYAGFLGRADRMVLMLTVPIVASALLRFDIVGLWRFTSILEIMLVYIGVMGILTTVQRFSKGLKAFDRDGQIRRED